jgi:hypothetical protein
MTNRTPYPPAPILPDGDAEATLENSSLRFGGVRDLAEAFARRREHVEEANLPRVATARWLLSCTE